MAILVHTDPLPNATYLAALRQAAPPSLPVWQEAEVPDPDAVEAVLAWRMKPGWLPRFPNLRVLCSIGAGVEKLWVPDLPPQVTVVRVVDPLQAQAMTRHVLAVTLQHLCELDRYRTQQAEARWERHPNRPVSQCRVGVLGLGEVGLAVAQGFAALGLPVTGWTRRPRALRPPGIACMAGDAALPALMAASDVLVCTLPLTPATQGLLDHQRLAWLPRGALVVNVGRGEHLVTEDLLALLDSGHLGGAALDVLPREPLPADHALWRHPKVVVTPHIAGTARDEVVAETVLQALASARVGQRPRHAVDPTAGY